MALTKSRIPSEMSLRKLPSGNRTPAKANRTTPIPRTKARPMTFRTITGYVIVKPSTTGRSTSSNLVAVPNQGLAQWHSRAPVAPTGKATS